MRRRNVKNIDTRIKKYPSILLENPNIYKGRWKELFGNSNQVYLEIGMGKGDFLLELATKNPDINYIGLEKFPSVIVVAMDKIAKTNLKNIKLICMDASNLNDVFDKNEIDKIYLNFSDPWPKYRHTKRRLTFQLFLKIYENILKNDSTIEFKTDNRKLFEFSLISFNQNNWEFLNLSFDLHNDFNTNEIAKTEYEKRFIELNQPIYFVEVRKNR